MFSYKFRAECFIDVARLLATLATEASVNHVSIAHFERDGLMEADCLVSFECSLPLADLITIAESTPDGHVMAQTMATAETYTGVR